MKRDFLDYLGDILTAIDEIADFTRGVSFDTFVQDRKTINAVMRSLEVLGEAASASLTTCVVKRPVFPGNTWQECEISSSIGILEWTSALFGR